MSRAQASFELALTDVNNLLRFHGERGGNLPGRRPADLGSLNKSAVVLLCAAWESYVEFVVLEAADRNIDSAAAPDGLLKPVRKLVASHIREGKDESAWQKAAGDGWRNLAKAVVRQRVAGLNTPKRGPIAHVMQTVLGVREIEGTWTWHRNPLGQPATRLDEFVALRGSIAHGERLAFSVSKSHVTRAQDLVTRLVEKIELRLVEENLLEAPHP